MTSHKKTEITEQQQRDELKTKLERLAWLTDSMITLPGGFKIGLESIIGIFPIVGDLISAVVSVYIIFIGMRAKVPKLVIGKLFYNVIVDTTLGAIPIIGDIFDMVFKSNEKNVQLLTRYVDQPEKTRNSIKLGMALLLCFLLAVIVIFLWLMFLFLKWFIGLF